MVPAALRGRRIWGALFFYVGVNRDEVAIFDLFVAVAGTAFADVAIRNSELQLEERIFFLFSSFLRCYFVESIVSFREEARHLGGYGGAGDRPPEPEQVQSFHGG